VVPAGTLFLVGDRRFDSRDSRVFGPVERGAVVGRVVAVLGSIAPGDGPRWSRTLRGVE
jgi:type IV secretory pathway protease TraF